MRKLRVPQGSLGKNFIILIASKRGSRRPILLGLVDIVKQRYEIYLKGRRTLETVQPLLWTENQQDALSHCYISHTATLAEIKKSVITALGEIKLCSYCLLRGIDEFDHVLPISHYPEFASLRINLVAACGKCNLAKGDISSLIPREIINPYFDQIPEKLALLYCRVEVTGSYPTFQFFIPDEIPGVDGAVIQLVKLHCDRFQLIKTYQAEAASLLAGWLRELAARFPAGMSEVELRKEIELQTARFSATWPINHWQVATWFGLEKCVELYAFVLQFIADNPAPPPALTRPRFAHLLNWF